MKLKIINLLSPSFGAFLLILIGSPGLSITKLFTNVFLPNEKIAFLILIFIVFKFKDIIYKNFKRLLIFSNLLFIFYLIFFAFREILFGIAITVPNINHFLGLISTLLFSAYLSILKKEVITKLLFYALSFQLFISLIQVIFVLTNNIELFSLTNNYYSQCFTCDGFEFPLSRFFTPRVPGLFNEASGLSAFSAFSLIYAISNSKFGRKFNFIPKYFKENNDSYIKQKIFSLNSLLVIFSIFGLFLSFSNTGLLMVIIFCFILFFETLSHGFGKIKLNYFITTISLTILLVQLKTIDLLKDTFTSAQRASWTYQTISNINNSNDLNFFIGSEAVWSGASWDSITRFIQMFGILGSIPLWIAIFYLNFSRNFLFCLSIIPLFMTNAQFSMPHSIIVLGFIIFLNFNVFEK